MIKILILMAFLVFSQIKGAREWGQSQFVFGDEDQTHWNLTLAQKRFQDAQFLQKYGLNEQAKNEQNAAHTYELKACEHFSKVVNRVDVNYLLDMMHQLSWSC